MPSTNPNASPSQCLWCGSQDGLVPVGDDGYLTCFECIVSSVRARFAHYFLKDHRAIAHVIYLQLQQQGAEGPRG